MRHEPAQPGLHRLSTLSALTHSIIPAHLPSRPDMRLPPLQTLPPERSSPFQHPAPIPPRGLADWLLMRKLRSCRKRSSGKAGLKEVRDQLVAGARQGEAQSASGTRAAGCPSRESGSRGVTASAKLGKSTGKNFAGWACAKALKLSASTARKAQCDWREM